MSGLETRPEAIEICSQCGWPVMTPLNRPLSVGADPCPTCGQIPLDAIVEKVYPGTTVAEVAKQVYEYRSERARLRTRWEQEGQPVSFREAVALIKQFPWPDPKTPEAWADFGLVMYGEDSEWIQTLLDIWHDENETHGDRFWAQEALAMIAKRVPEHPRTVEILARLASGSLNRPRGREKRTNIVRDMHIVRAITHLQGQGMNATRNDASPEHSACDAVAEALGLEEQEHERIKTVWKRRTDPKNWH